MSLGAGSIGAMSKLKILATLFAAALLAAPGAVMAQDFDDDFGDDFGSDDFGNDDFGNDDFGSNDFGSNSDTTAAAPASNSPASGDRGIGVGAMAPLANVGGLVGLLFGAGPAVSYDMGDFHIDGVLLFETNGATAFGLSGRFWYHLFERSDADFSAGGGFTFINVDPEIGDSSNAVFLEAGAKIRMFLVDNVALSTSTGLVIGLADAEGVELGGQILGGVIYYF
jgi:hypothetical protein